MIEIVVEISLAELFAQIVNGVAECTPVGVPVISFVVVLRAPRCTRKESSGASDVYKSQPPTLVGVTPLTRLFLVNVNGEPAYEMSAASS
mgnify:CR=1 FL=1